MKKKEDQYSVVQSNPLVEAQYKLDVLPQKIIRYLISKIKPDDKTFEKYVYRLTVSDFSALIGREYTGQAIEDVKVAAERLLRTQITIRRGREITRSNWIASYKQHIDEGWFEFSFSIHLERELLLIQNQFTQYHLANISKLKSQYSIRLYELLKQYLTIGERKILLDDLKQMLGIDKTEYPLFGNIRAKVLNPAHKEICNKTDIDYQWKPFKHVRKIIGVEFYEIRRKSKIPDEVLAVLPVKYRENKDILDNVTRWIELKGMAYVIEKTHYTISRNPEKFGDYLYQCLENDYGQGFNPMQEPLPFENPATVGISIKDGMKIEIDGVEYVVEDGHIRTVGGIIPIGTIRQGIKDGKFKVSYSL